MSERTVNRFIDAMNAQDFAKVEMLLAEFLLLEDTGLTGRGREQCLKLFTKAMARAGRAFENPGTAVFFARPFDVAVHRGRQGPGKEQES